MLWLTYAIASIFLMGAFNLFLQATKDTIPKEFHYTHIYLCCILVLAGILGGISLICYQVLYPNALSELCTDCFKPYYMIVTIPAMLLFTSLITNTLALAQGGGIAVSIINLNMFFTIFVGTLLFGDKINYRIIIAMIVAVVAITIGTYESYRINN